MEHFDKLPSGKEPPDYGIRPEPLLREYDAQTALRSVPDVSGLSEGEAEPLLHQWAAEAVRDRCLPGFGDTPLEGSPYEQCAVLTQWREVPDAREKARRLEAVSYTETERVRAAAGDDAAGWFLEVLGAEDQACRDNFPGYRQEAIKIAARGDGVYLARQLADGLISEEKVRSEAGDSWDHPDFALARAAETSLIESGVRGPADWDVVRREEALYWLARADADAYLRDGAHEDNT